ncbi:rhomboid family intramembrane serine protease [Hufsiella ginkgonis]|uniref:Rhomboid family intramembrane serine protease n=1 Tax=Hufsiella ginkgonis TaxID=2695274 RepID=A0A7K1Y1N0_9SPHI|nr:rhomboid family intramembrane serine protease [Hufsiella ginkgonis]MXV16929.1 rhomboid family intramembrane serine protease [Hufsiella ginkgonis]
MSSYRPSPFANITPVVKNLLIINIIFFIATYLFSNFPVTYYLGISYFDSNMFKVWQLVTYMFMHGGFQHILFNMLGLFSFGIILEQVMGSKRFLNFYLITGIGAALLHMTVVAFEVHAITGSFINPGVVVNSDHSGTIAIPGLDGAQQQQLFDLYAAPMVGASGAIFGLLLAFGMLFPEMEISMMFIPVPVKAKVIIPLYIVVELFFGVHKIPGDSVAHFAHLGGALFGYLLLKAWGIRQPGGYL